MKILLFVFVLLSISSLSFPQDDVRVKNLLSKVDDELNRFESNTIISKTNRCLSGKRVVINGQNGQYTFTSIVKYYNGGLKKEKIQIYKFNAWGRSVLICMLVKINDQIFYIEYFETNEDKALTKKTKEVYIANKCYQKTNLDSRGYTTSTENYVAPMSVYK